DKISDNEDNKLQDINIIIGKYLLSIYYYKDIILIKKESTHEGKQKYKKTIEASVMAVNANSHELGYYYLNFEEADNKDEMKAFESFLKLAESGNTNAQNTVGNCYLNGKGTEKDENKSFEWFTKSSKGGNV